MEEQQKVKKGWKRFWIGFDTILLSFYLLLIVITVYPGMFRYYDGLNDTYLTFGIACFMFPLTAVSMGVLIFRVVFWTKHFKSKKTLWIAILLLIFCNPISFLMYPFGVPGYISYTNGFHQRMQKRLDVAGLRIWLEGLEDEIFDGEYYDILYQSEVFPVPIPQEISSLSEHVHYLVLYKEDQMRCLRIEWGGPFARWGVVIGADVMPVPPTKELSYDEYGLRNIGEYRIKFEDGVYVWHNIK